ncbi:hypothetical protein KA517_00605 [Candidatus Gracilibacteria bacterium]|nr:hypothetical protein [Candidatus Gracilibacteria bacterium]
MKTTPEVSTLPGDLKRNFFQLLASDKASKRAEVTSEAGRRSLDAGEMELQMAMHELVTKPNPDRLVVAPLLSYAAALSTIHPDALRDGNNATKAAVATGVIHQFSDKLYPEMKRENRTTVKALGLGLGGVDTMHLQSILPASVFRKDYDDLVALRNTCAASAREGKPIGDALRQGVHRVSSSIKNLYAVMHVSKTSAELQKMKGEMAIINSALAETLLLLERVQSSESIARQLGHARSITSIMEELS